MESVHSSSNGDVTTPQIVAGATATTSSASSGGSASASANASASGGSADWDNRSIRQTRNASMDMVDLAVKSLPPQQRNTYHQPPSPAHKQMTSSSSLLAGSFRTAATDLSSRLNFSDGDDHQPGGHDGLNNSVRSVSGRSIRSKPKLATTTNRMYTKNKLTEIAQNKLDFSRLGLVGRKDETEILDRLFRQIISQSSSSSAQAPTNNMKTDGLQSGSSYRCDMTGQTTSLQLPSTATANTAITESADHSSGARTIRCFASIYGSAGTGKTTLAETLRPKCMANHTFYITGKFDLKKAEEPFFGFKHAMAELCTQIKNLPREPEVLFTNSDNVSSISSGTDSSSSLFQESEQSSSSFVRPKKSKRRRDPRKFDELKNLIVQGMDIKELQILSSLIPDMIDIVGDELLTAEISRHPRLAVQESFGKEEDGDQSLGDSRKSYQRRKSFRSLLKNGSRKKGTWAPQNQTGFREKSDTLKFAFRSFIKIICKYCPLVWVSDDVQWADRVCLDMMESLLLDTTISSLMIVACHRSEADSSDEDIAAPGDQPNTNPVHRMLDSIRSYKTQRSIEVVEIQIGALSTNHIQSMLIELLDYDESIMQEQMNSLAAIIHKRTDGNAFFVQQFLRLLVNENLLVFNIGTLKWTWDDEEIKRQSPATVNVVELMQSKLQKISAARYVLPLAACLGATFSSDLLRQALYGFLQSDEHLQFYEDVFQNCPPTDETELLTILTRCQEEGLIDSHDAALHHGDCHSQDYEMPMNDVDIPKEYFFLHDKIQEAALALVPDEKLPELQYRIGDILMSSLSKRELDQYLFVVVNLLNNRLDMVPPYADADNIDELSCCARFRVAELNYMAGSKAALCSAFCVALEYLKSAAEMLPTKHWETHFEMSLEIYTTATECAFVCSKFEDMHRFGNVVVGLDCEVLQKMRVFYVLMDTSLGEAEFNKAKDATALGCEVLSLFGIKFPKRKTTRSFSALIGLAKVGSSMKAWTPQVIDALPESDDPRELAITKTLHKLSDAAYMSDSDLLPLAFLKSLNRTFTNGVTVNSPSVFATLGMLFGFIMGQVAAGQTFANHAITMVHKINDQSSEARVYMICHSMVFHLTQPYEMSKEPLLKAYTVGMATGDVISALWCMYFYLDICWLTGRPLDTLESDFSTYSKVCQDFRQYKHFDCMAMYHQMTLNLRGKSGQLTMLVGVAFNEVAALRRYREKDDIIAEMIFWRFKIATTLYYGEYEAAADGAAVAYDIYIKKLAGQTACFPFAFACSLACYIAASSSSASANSRPKSAKRKFHRLATKARQLVQKFANKGNPNCAHYLAMLEAERSRIKNRHDDVIKNYQQSIRLAGRRGIVQDQALANERLADYWKLKKDTDSTKFYLKEAIRLYTEWGAEGKVNILEASFENLQQPPTEINISVMDL